MEYRSTTKSELDAAQHSAFTAHGELIGLQYGADRILIPFGTVEAAIFQYPTLHLGRRADQCTSYSITRISCPIKPVPAKLHATALLLLATYSPSHVISVDTSFLITSIHLDPKCIYLNLLTPTVRHLPTLIPFQ